MYLLSEGDRLFREAMERCAIAPADFDHRAHLRLAYIYLSEHDIDAAVAATRTTLLRLLTHNGIDAAKFHVTLTRAWLMAVKHFMVKAGEATCADDFIDRSAVLLDSRAMLTHYSPELLFSTGARREFVAPDLDPIPDHESRSRTGD